MFASTKLSELFATMALSVLGSLAHTRKDCLKPINSRPELAAHSGVF